MQIVNTVKTSEQYYLAESVSNVNPVRSDNWLSQGNLIQDLLNRNRSYHTETKYIVCHEMLISHHFCILGQFKKLTRAAFKQIIIVML